MHACERGLGQEEREPERSASTAALASFLLRATFLAFPWAPGKVPMAAPQTGLLATSPHPAQNKPGLQRVKEAAEIIYLY